MLFTIGRAFGFFAALCYALGVVLVCTVGFLATIFILGLIYEAHLSMKTVRALRAAEDDLGKPHPSKWRVFLFVFGNNDNRFEVNHDGFTRDVPGSRCCDWSSEG